MIDKEQSDATREREKRMHPASSMSLTRLVFACGCAAVLILLSSLVAAAEGMSASASVVPNSTATIDALRQQIVALEKRVTELEKPQTEEAEGVKDDADEQAQVAAKKLEQRLANLEKNQEAAKTEKIVDKDESEYDAPLTLKAPFTVVDSDGKPLMRVSEKDGEFSRGMYIYNNSGGAVAHVGASSLGMGRVYVSSDGAMPVVGMVVDENGGKFMLYQGRDKLFEVNKQALTLYNSNGTSTVALQTAEESKAGKLILFNGAGRVMVQAGMTPKGVGAVFTGPNSNGGAASLTGGGKEASTITGRAD